MRRPLMLSIVAMLCLSGGCLSNAPATEPTSTSVPPSTTATATTTGATASTTTPERTGSPTRDPMVLDEIVEVQSESNRTHDVSVAVLNLADNATVRTVNRTLAPDGEFSLSRPVGAEHRRVVVRVDGTVVFDRTVYTAEQYWVTVHDASTVTVSKAVA